jgi:glycosyltransferase involved in cell wall biosynthesis
MKAHGATEKRGLVVSYSAEEWTRVAFMGSLIRLRKSDGVGFSFHHMTRAPIHYARNAVADFALDQGFDWLIQLDDDATFPDDVVRRLLTHDKEVVTALAYQRKPPYLPCIYECNDNVDQMIGRPLEGVEHTGLRRVDVSGFHVSVIQTSVIKKLRDAGIRQYYGGFDNKVGEDFAMCLNLKKVGVKVHCDTGLIAGHLGASVEINEEYRKRYLAGTAP